MTSNENFTENFGGLTARGQPFAQFSFNVNALKGGNVNYNPPAGGIPFLLDQDYLQLLFTLQPIPPAHRGPDLSARSRSRCA